MTEITDKLKNTEPEIVAKRHLVDPVAFALAVVGGPLLAGLIGAPTLISPFATLIGGPVYVLAGTPIMLAYLAMRDSTPEAWAGLAFLTNLILFGIILQLPDMSRSTQSWDGMRLVWGSLFAPIWGWISGCIYASLKRDFYKQPL
ncbi:hypothetical protein PXK58_04740 [Phaeobacter gallaeciensis]|uniref:hypothetical protein n=1 Tax=Phaeobacter gallaeciensis TaxID=60890 RepID=UPI0023806C42|nr:hypothetical protein [Phaeobacter gallaeciensis]MDE4273606.1 hypothetical protein [Phaeobacter gallaeciensis]MDE4298846.1 hypothetical protein [Phaeobacter gallaeciensis]MDE5183592.1 hypothetical protein [Phaeobacter gallaeciensis]MEC9310616.1 hypothetical protein [Pseudomonadota bacterium]